jgi:hypothetical protein
METYKTTFELLGEPTVEKTESNELILGVLGSSSAAYWNRETITDIMNPVIGDQGKIPSLLHIPTDGATSLLIQIWGERQAIKCAPINADWIRMGRRARALRDARIIKESTHLIFFVGIKSDYYEKMAIREAKKGKTVYTIGADRELVKWVL